MDEVAAGLERLLGLIRRLGPPGLSLTAAATLGTLERSGPRRLTALAAAEGVTQPAMTQLIGRLADAGLVARLADPADGRVVHVQITDAGKDLVVSHRIAHAKRLSRLLTALTLADRQALAAALPAMDALVRAQRDVAGERALANDASAVVPARTAGRVRR